MTKLLIKRFIKDYENTQNSDVRTAYGKFSSIVGIVCNAILFISKLIVGTLSASVSITADAVNNLSDASSSIISLLGFKLASRPADEEHPYGHGRYEYLSGLMVWIRYFIRQRLNSVGLLSVCLRFRFCLKRGWHCLIRKQVK